MSITTPNNFRDNYVVVLDSLDRDLSKHPNPSEYTIPLPETLRNVETIELLSFQMTRTEMNVNSNNNTFIITEKRMSGNTVVSETTFPTIVIPENNYETVAALVNAIPLPSSSYSVSVDASNIITIKRPVVENVYSVSFTIQVTEGSSQLLGIVATGVRGSGTVSSSALPLSYVGITGKSIIDISGVPYLTVHLNDYERIISSGNQSHKKFLVVPMENYAVGRRFLICGDQKEKKGIYILTNHQKTMYEMRVKICRPDGSLYDFKGTNHIFIFRIYRHDYRDFNS